MSADIEKNNKLSIGHRSLQYWKIFKKTLAYFVEDDSFTYAASIAYYTIFSLPAVLIISIWIGARLYEQNTVRDEMINQVALLVGPSSASELELIIVNASFDVSGSVAQAIGIVTLIFSATTVFMSLQNSLNRIWNIKAKPERGFVKYLIDRLLSLAMVISLGFILLVSLVIDAVLVVFQNSVSKLLPDFTLYLLSAINIAISLAFITVIFALMFKVLPDATVKWRDVWIGALITTALFVLGKYLIGFYLGSSQIGSAYGAAGSLVIILVWVYYSSAIFLFGAEFTYVYAEEIGEKIKPYRNAVKVELVELEKNT